MIIVFSGTDGSGKSTQIDLLSTYVKSRQCKSKIVWARGGYTPIFSLIKKILRTLLMRRIPEPGASDSRESIFRKRGVSRVWLTIATFDLFLFYGLYVRTLSLLGYIVICDRYIKDTEIDFRRNFPDNFNTEVFLWKLLVWSLPMPNQSFLLYVPVEISLIRSKIKGEPFPDTPATLNFRLKTYLDESIFPSAKYNKIDCQKSIESVQIEIREKFKGLF